MDGNGHPQLVGTRGGELAVDQVQSALGSQIGEGSAHLVGPHSTAPSALAHQPLDGAAGSEGTAWEKLRSPPWHPLSRHPGSRWFISALAE